MCLPRARLRLREIAVDTVGVTQRGRTSAVLLLVFLVVAVGLVPIARGDLRRLAHIRFRSMWLLGVALAMQVGLYLLPGDANLVREFVYLCSYPLALLFVLANRRIPGLWLIGAGAGLNLLAMAANGGSMPATAHALAAAGLPADPGAFTNSLVLGSPHLLFLGDVFAVPRTIPFANVFSVGDVLIALGGALAVHRVCGSRLIPSGDRQFASVLSDRNFVRVWLAQGVSNLGDWVYVIAVASTLASRSGSRGHLAQTLAFLLIAQVGPAALAGALFAGALADRLPRRGLMVGADLIRGVAVASLLLDPHPGLVHFAAVGACLGVFGAIFQPALQASIPNLVPRDRIVAANALVGTTYQISVMVGPALGGVLIAQTSAGWVFSANTVSFAVSAVLLISTTIPQVARERMRSGLRAVGAELARGFRFAASTPIVRGIFVVTSLVMLAAASKAPIEPLFVRQVLTQGPDLARTAQVLGLITGAWGMGMLLGSVAAPALARRWRRERLLALSIATVGALVLLVSRTGDFSTVLLAWLVAGSANAVGNVSYETLLQERTPDAVRGRVLAASEACLDAAYLAGALLASRLGSAFRAPLALAVSGAILLLAAALAFVLLPVHRSSRRGPEPLAEPAPEPFLSPS
jgi:MFS family permease